MMGLGSVAAYPQRPFVQLRVAQQEPAEQLAPLASHAHFPAVQRWVQQSEFCVQPAA